MNIIDYIFIIAALIAMIIGLNRGFTKVLLRWAFLIASVAIALSFGGWAAEKLGQAMSRDIHWAFGAAGLFVLSFAVLTVVRVIIGRPQNKTNRRLRVDSLLGGLIMICAAFALFAGATLLVNTFKESFLEGIYAEWGQSLFGEFFLRIMKL